MSFLDEATTALVRPYAITQGRTRPRRHISIEALVGTTVYGRRVADQGGLANESHDAVTIAIMCYDVLQSLAEITAFLRLPLGVTRVIVADMAARGLLTVLEPLPSDDPSSPHVLERILTGLRSL